MARPTRASQEEGYVRSFWEELRGLEADYGGVALVTLQPARRAGTLTIRIAYTPILDTEVNPLGTHAVQVDYPNSHPQALSGALWQAAMALARQLADSPRGRELRARHND